jgi:hypothetical protein
MRRVRSFFQRIFIKTVSSHDDVAGDVLRSITTCGVVRARVSNERFAYRLRLTAVEANRLGITVNPSPSLAFSVDRRKCRLIDEVRNPVAVLVFALRPTFPPFYEYEAVTYIKRVAELVHGRAPPVPVVIMADTKVAQAAFRDGEQWWEFDMDRDVSARFYAPLNPVISPHLQISVPEGLPVVYEGGAGDDGFAE